MITKAAPVADKDPIPIQNLWDIIGSGGVMMIPIGICSLLLVAFVFERAVSLRHGRIIPKPFVRRFLEQMREGELDRETALGLCEESGSPVSEVFAGAPFANGDARRSRSNRPSSTPANA